MKFLNRLTQYLSSQPPEPSPLRQTLLDIQSALELTNRERLAQIALETRSRFPQLFESTPQTMDGQELVTVVTYIEDDCRDEIAELLQSRPVSDQK